MAATADSAPKSAVEKRDDRLRRSPARCRLVGTLADHARIWLVTFMHYDLGYFDDEVGRVEPIENPFGSKVLPMCSV